MKMNGRKGFTMVELIVVIMIVIALAGMSIPLMTGNLKRARATEAVATLGAIRTQMRLVKAETNSFLKIPGRSADLSANIVYNVGGTVPGFPATTDLDGSYFPGENYKIEVTSATAFKAYVTGTSAKKTDKVKVTIDQDGKITEDYNAT